MRYRQLGKTGIRVSEIGFGAWGIGGATADGPNSYGATDDAVSLKALRTAFEKGITLYDTSNIYGYGHSEELLGRAFKDMRDKVVFASKVGFVKHDGPYDFSEKWIRKQIEEQLRRLETDYLDIYQIHSPPLDLLRASEEIFPTLADLKRQGKIRAIGISLKSPADGLAAIEEFKPETIQVNFSLIDQRAFENGIFEAAGRNGVGIIARTPLAYGFLSGKIKDLNFPAQDHRSRWPEGQLKLWAEAPELFRFLAQGRQASATQLAIKFCLSFPEVSAVIPGILTPEEAVENAAASEVADFTPAEIEQVRQVYASHEFFERPAKS